MTITDWSIEEPHVANCNCDTGCPCQFTALPTDGACKAVLGWQIDKGHFGETRLDGLLAVGTSAHGYPLASRPGRPMAAIWVPAMDPTSRPKDRSGSVPADR
ncbi:MAG: DUF1326 domain-containing protein [Hyphomicrobiaceae bacterium]